MVLGFIGWVAWTWPESGTEPEGQEQRLDFTKPLFVRAGAVACPTSDEIRAIYQAKISGREYVPGDCGTVKRDEAVVIIEDAASGGYRVRFIRVAQDAEAWVAYPSLHN